MDHSDCSGCIDCSFVIVATPIPPDLHEIHITVKADDVARFVSVCEENSIKPIVIAYQTKSVVELTDVMTSQKFQGNIHKALAEAQRIAALLADDGFSVIRVKIETTITNPIWRNRPDGYHEAHLEIVGVSTDETQFRAAIAQYPKLHASRNAFKDNADGKTIMVTYRASGNHPNTFSAQVDEYARLLKQDGFDTHRKIVEFCWHDTHVEHDNAWMEIA